MREPPPSLKAVALRWLAQREHSRVELRVKLRRRAVAGCAEPEAEGSIDARVDEVLDWLEAQRHLSSERFVESRVRARQDRFGRRRIAMELGQHRLELPPDAAAALSATEFERARALDRRRHPAPPANPAERARRARFLAGRGFTTDVVLRVLRPAAGTEDDDPG